MTFIIHWQLVKSICCIKLSKCRTAFQLCSNVVKRMQWIFLMLNSSVHAHKVNTYAYVVTMTFLSFYLGAPSVGGLRHLVLPHQSLACDQFKLVDLVWVETVLDVALEHYTACFPLSTWWAQNVLWQYSKAWYELSQACSAISDPYELTDYDQVNCSCMGQHTHQTSPPGKLF